MLSPVHGAEIPAVIRDKGPALLEVPCWMGVGERKITFKSRQILCQGVVKAMKKNKAG